MSSSDEDIIVLIAARRVKKRRRSWISVINDGRTRFGEFHHLYRQLESEEDQFFKYFRMSPYMFNDLHNLIEGQITKTTTNWRSPISAKERLAVCLRFLATGDSYRTIAFSYRMGHSTVAAIVREVCQVIWTSLQPTHMPTPTNEDWVLAEKGFREIWGFPNCVGAIDGKHVAVKCPPNSGSSFFCYKQFFSIVLLAIVDPHYKFTMVDIGSYGRHGDNAILENSEFFKRYLRDGAILPPKPLPGTNEAVPHVLVGDEGFALRTYLMRPFPRAAAIHDERKKTFNKRLSRSRRIVENAFGILAQKWRIFRRPIESDIKTTVHIVKAACVLHNYTKASTIVYDADIDSTCIGSLTPSQPSNRRHTNEAFLVREKFANYFFNV